MKKVYTANSSVDLTNAQNVLDSNDIPSEKRNELFLAEKGFPFIDRAPELWVVDDKHELRAKRLIEEELNRPITGETWRCEQCGETSGVQFTECWQCGASRKVSE